MREDHLEPLSKLVILLALFLMAGGFLWHGVTQETFQRFWDDLAGRPSGPMALRFLVQPLMAAAAGLHDGIKDGQTGRAPYFWTIVLKPRERAGRLCEGLNATARIVLAGLAVDVLYQMIVLETFYPGEAVITVLLLAFVPYLLIRGPAARIARRHRDDESSGENA